MSPGEIALLISFGSLLVAAISLGWNIYRDVVRKPALRVRLMVGQIAHSTFYEDLGRVIVTITNFGPGKSEANMLLLRKTSWWRRLFKKRVLAILMPDDDPLSGRLPAPLDVGQKVNLTFRFGPDIFLLKDFSQIGISDTFGKEYWCPKRDYRRAQASYREQSRIA